MIIVLLYFFYTLLFPLIMCFKNKFNIYKIFQIIDYKNIAIDILNNIKEGMK